MRGIQILRALSRVWLAWLLLQAGVVATVVLTVLYVNDLQTSRILESEIAADEVANAVEARLRSNIEVIYAVRGLFSAMRAVSPDDFQRFVGSLELSQRYSGMEHILFDARVDRSERDAFERRVREFGGRYRDFSIKPPGVREEYFPTLFNVRTSAGEAPLGMDQFSDRTCREAIMAAAERGVLIALGPVPYLNDPGRRAFFLFLPVYRNGATTAGAGRSGVAGVVRATFRVEELVANVARGAHLTQRRFALFDAGDGRGSEAGTRLLYDSAGMVAVGTTMAGFGAIGPVRTVRFGGRTWRVAVAPPEAVTYADWLVPLCAGLTISLLLFALVLALTRATQRAHALANQVVRKLRATEQHIARTEQFSSVMVLHADLDGRILKVPPTFCRLMGHGEGALLTRRVDDLIHPRHRAAWKRRLGALTSGQLESVDSEEHCTRADGDEVWLALSCLLVRDDDKQPLHLLIYALDVTARVSADTELRRLHADLERQVEQRTAQLRAANHELESFSYSVSHDLRASVRHIAGFARMLESELTPAAGAQALRHLQRIGAAAARMGELIDDLLFFARATRAELRLSALDMNAAVQRALDELAPELAGRNIRFEIASLPAADADRGLLHQVWVNLLSNAIKYTARRDDAVITVGAVSGGDGEQAYFVRDNGVGFEQSSAHRLFGVFQRLHTREEFEGTGIGLATVQRIVHRHGGRVWAEGATGRGATFGFALPRVAPAQDLPRSAASA
jgi:PAS domain S-box-containing protein